MTLRDWMRHTNTGPAALAAILGVHWVTIYKWASGTARPSFAKLSLIEEVTGGKVTARSLAQEANDAPVSAPKPAASAEVL